MGRCLPVPKEELAILNPELNIEELTEFLLLNLTATLEAFRDKTLNSFFAFLLDI